MSIRISIFLTVFQVISTLALIPQYTTAGKRFVFCFPYIGEREDEFDDVYHHAGVKMNTEEAKADVVLYHPDDNHNLKRTLFGNKTLWVHFRPPYVSYINRTGVYSGYYAVANVPIRLLVFTTAYQSTKGSVSAAFRVLPERSCSTSYYVSTTFDHPFIILMSFSSAVKVKIHFPESTQAFNVSCSADKSCASNSSVVLTLGQKMVWYLRIENTTFQNTWVETDRPIYVVAGSEEHSNPGGHCVRHVTSNHTWGKEYVIPRFESEETKTVTLRIRFNARELPFHYKVFDNGKEIRKVLDSFEEVVSYADFVRPIIVSASVPFGLYQVVLRESLQAGCLDVIPTEQWVNGGAKYVEDGNDPSRWTSEIFLLTTADPNNVVLTGHGNSVKWEKPIGYTLRTYNYGKMKAVSFPFDLFSNESNGRIMIYKMNQGRKEMNESRLFWPVDFYSGKIYDEKCRRVNAFLSDGVDNDCDGFIDEEWENGIDDDGDGLVDEDYLETPAMDEWTAWRTVCQTVCDGFFYRHKIREYITHRFGNDGTTCEGMTETCRPSDTCPFHCKKKEVEPVKVCECQPGCRTYELDNVSLSTPCHCSECRDGYHNGQFCLRKCPDGWRGEGCSLGPRFQDFLLINPHPKMKFHLNAFFMFISIRRKEDKVQLTVLLVLSFLLVIFLGIISFLHKRMATTKHLDEEQNGQKKQQQEQQQQQESQQEQKDQQQKLQEQQNQQQEQQLGEEGDKERNEAKDKEQDEVEDKEQDEVESVAHENEEQWENSRKRWGSLIT